MTKVAGMTLQSENAAQLKCAAVFYTELSNFIAQNNTTILDGDNSNFPNFLTDAHNGRFTTEFEDCNRIKS